MTLQVPLVLFCPSTVSVLATTSSDFSSCSLPSPVSISYRITSAPAWGLMKSSGQPRFPITVGPTAAWIRSGWI
uniref:Putative secreted protein n=1 Tax=Anopheles marajoara TaxID=58244 RepID=A0A2M4CEI1_9DIPT